jgi:hypothetical protein
VISSVVFCPQAPVLVPDLAQDAAAELDDLRIACRTAIRRAVPDGVRPVLVGGGPTAAQYPSSARGTFAGFGVPLEVPLGSDEPGPVVLSPSLTVGAWLVREALGPDTGAAAISVTDADGRLPDFADPDCVALVVLGDGSARRTEKAPGYLDARAAEFDDLLCTALRDGTGAQLHRDRLDRYGANELLVSGLAAWDAVAPVIETVTWDAELLYYGWPYGVGYFVAVWTRGG